MIANSVPEGKVNVHKIIDNAIANDYHNGNRDFPENEDKNLPLLLYPG